MQCAPSDSRETLGSDARLPLALPYESDVLFHDMYRVCPSQEHPGHLSAARSELCSGNFESPRGQGALRRVRS